MKAKRWISLLLAVSMMLGVLAMPASAAAQQPESTAVVSEELPDAAALSAAEDENDIVNIRIRATGNLVYGSDYKLEVETRPENTQYIAVVLGTSGEAYGYVTLMISDKLRTLLKLIPLPKKMSQTPDQAEEFNVYSYLKQLIDGNDVGVLLRVADEVVSVMDTVSFFVPAGYLTTVKNVSNGMKLALSLIRKYLPEGALSRIYLDEQPKDSGKYFAGAIALESSTAAPASWPRLCASAAPAQKIYPLIGRCSSTSMTTSDKPPPQRERKPAVAPRVKKANSAFSTTSSSAVRVRRNNSAYMTTTLESPSFMAGINPSSGDTSDSR